MIVPAAPPKRSVASNPKPSARLRPREIQKLFREAFSRSTLPSSRCGPCRAFAPVYESVAGKHPDIVFGKVDTEAETGLAAAFKTRSIPNLMVFRDGVLVFAEDCGRRRHRGARRGVSPTAARDSNP